MTCLLDSRKLYFGRWGWTDLWGGDGLDDLELSRQYRIYLSQDMLHLFHGKEGGVTS